MNYKQSSVNLILLYGKYCIWKRLLVLAKSLVILYSVFLGTKQSSIYCIIGRPACTVQCVFEPEVTVVGLL